MSAPAGSPARCDSPAARALRRHMAKHLPGPRDLWWNAVAQVPRHHFVPAYLTREDGRWQTVTAQDRGYLTGVYTDQALAIQAGDGARPTSAATQPGLVLGMLRALDARPSSAVLEIGTGTGYNAALLAHVLGPGRVTTIEADPELAAQAGLALAAAGHEVTVHTGDGLAGFRNRAPYDRITATFRIPAVPAAWLRQAAPGAVITAPLGTGIVRLTTDRPGHAEGRFLPGPAHFMPHRGHDPGRPRFTEAESAPPRRTPVPLARLLTDLAFPVSVLLGHPTVQVWTHPRTGTIEAAGLWTRHRTALLHHDGTVLLTGPRSWWHTLEALHHDLPAPAAREEFGLTVTPTGQRLWHHTPHGPGWTLTPPATTTSTTR